MPCTCDLLVGRDTGNYEECLYPVLLLPRDMPGGGNRYPARPYPEDDQEGHRALLRRRADPQILCRHPVGEYTSGGHRAGIPGHLTTLSRPVLPAQIPSPPAAWAGHFQSRVRRGGSRCSLFAGAVFPGDDRRREYRAPGKRKK